MVCLMHRDRLSYVMLLWERGYKNVLFAMFCKHKKTSQNCPKNTYNFIGQNLNIDYIYYAHFLPVFVQIKKCYETASACCYAVRSIGQRDFLRIFLLSTFEKSMCCRGSTGNVGFFCLFHSRNDFIEISA